MQVFMLTLEELAPGGMTWNHLHIPSFFFSVAAFLGRDIRSVPYSVQSVTLPDPLSQCSGVTFL